MSGEHLSGDPPSIMESVQAAVARSRRAAARLGVTEEAVAAAEDEVAEMFERLAQSGGPRAAHHRAVAARARQHAHAARLVAELEYRVASGQEDTADDVSDGGAADPPQPS